MEAGREWPGVKPDDLRVAPGAGWTPPQRINDLNSLGGDGPVVSAGAAFYFYDRAPQRIARMPREYNSEKEAILWRNTGCIPKPIRHAPDRSYRE